MKRLLLIPGDGIGPEILLQGKKLLSALGKMKKIEFQLDEVDWGANKWLKEGVGIPKGELPYIPERYDAILFGAIGDPRIKDMAHGREILLGLRMGLDLFINIRPIKLLTPRLTPLRDKESSQINLVIVRENTEDIYGGMGGALHLNTLREIAIDESLHTYGGVERILRAAFIYAIKYKRSKVTMVDKSNAIKFGGDLWQRLFKKISQEFPKIEADHLYVDVAAMQMVQNPGRFDVVVTTNLFGDILSDLGAGLAGGLGLMASANINPGVIALFEPVHGSAPDIAGLDIANPFAMFLSIAMMLEYFDYQDEAALIERLIINAIEEHRCTPDIGGSLSTSQAADQLISQCLT